MRRNKYFAAQMNALWSEIELSARWKGPIILFAIYRSSHVFEDAEAFLKEALEEKGQQKLVPVRITSALPNLIEIIEPFDFERSVFSVIDFNEGGGENRADAYRFLNLHREYFIEKKVRLVCWVTEEEAKRLALVAPDFWAFRHGVFDFTKNRATPKRSAIFSGLAWYEFPWQQVYSDVEAAIVYRQKLLRDMLGLAETLFMCLDVSGELAGLYFQKGDIEETMQIIMESLEQLPSESSSAVEVNFLIGLAVASLLKKKYAQAYASVQRALVVAPKNAYLYTLLAEVYRREGRRSDALSSVQKALKLKPTLAVAWNEAGNIYVDLGRLESALDAYQNAMDVVDNSIPLLN